MQTQTIYTNQTVSRAVGEALCETLVNYLWKLVDERDDNQSEHMFAIGKGELFGMELLQVVHQQAGDERVHKVFGVPPVEAIVMVRRRDGGYHMEMGWEACAA